MECKKALVETGGDMEAAVEHLRKSGLAKADKKAGRVASEGAVVEAAGANGAVLVEINCETDFVAKDDNFRAFAKRVAEIALSSGIDDVRRWKTPSLPTARPSRRGVSSLSPRWAKISSCVGFGTSVPTAASSPATFTAAASACW